MRETGEIIFFQQKRRLRLLNRYRCIIMVLPLICQDRQTLKTVQKLPESSLKYDMKLVTADGSSYDLFRGLWRYGESHTSFGSGQFFCIPALHEPFYEKRSRYQEAIPWKAVMKILMTAAHPAMMSPVTAVRPVMIHPATAVPPVMTLPATAVTPAMILPVMIAATMIAVARSSSDDGNYDDGSYDDGSYDDGSYDNDYVDEGSDSGDYDTDESSSSDWDY